jgi:hypothetical protein
MILFRSRSVPSGQRVGETPDGSRFKLLVPLFEVEVMHSARKMLWSFKFAFHERLVDDDLGRNIREFAPLPRFHLLAHRLKVPLHPIHSDRHAIDQRERLRVFGKNRRKHARDNVAKLKLSTVLTCDPIRARDRPAMISMSRSRDSNSHGLK